MKRMCIRNFVDVVHDMTHVELYGSMLSEFLNNAGYTQVEMSYGAFNRIYVFRDDLKYHVLCIAYYASIVCTRVSHCIKTALRR